MNTFGVLKFGGTSVSSHDNWKKIDKIIEKKLKKTKKLLIVCSALSGVSNTLEEFLNNPSDWEQSFNSIKNKHESICHDLSVDFKILDKELSELKELFIGISLTKEVTPRLHAKVMAKGEILLTLMGEYYLASKVDIEWFDARNGLKVKKNKSDMYHFLQNHCGTEKDAELINKISKIKSRVIITQGFIASDANNETVLLGRGGSDTSASYFAAKLGANYLEIWTDVLGMYTTSPRLVKNAKLIKRLDYIEAQEMASAGAKVLHPKCIPPVQKANIPLSIKCTSMPDVEGTVIEHSSATDGPQLKAVVTQDNITLITIENYDMWHEVGYLAKVFSKIAEFELSVDLLSTSETSLSVTLDAFSSQLIPESFERLKTSLEEFGDVEIRSECSVVCLVGKNVRSLFKKLSPVFKIFEEEKIFMVSQSSSDLNLSFVLHQHKLPKILKEIHQHLFEKDDSVIFGKTWSKQFEDNPTIINERIPWWIKESKKLKMIDLKNRPAYVYNLDVVRQQIKKLKKVNAVKKYYFAMKANNNEEVLKLIYSEGFGIECVSINEVKLLRKIIPSIQGKEILFTPNFVGKNEYEDAYKYDLNVTLDCIYPLEHWPEVFSQKKVILRVDPGKGTGHHEYVKTAGDSSKFGLNQYELEKIGNLVDTHNVKVIGLHAHAGSGILDSSHWKQMAIFLSSFAKKFKDVQILNLGGGIGVPMHPSEPEINLEDLIANLNDFAKAFPGLELWMEPGRFVVAEAGVILSQVTQIKKKGNHHYVGLNVGMCSLIRPALYGSYHHIVNLDRLNEKHNWKVNIVGPICETGDVLGRGRDFPLTKENDLVLIDTVGAYGKVMESNYNLRGNLPEIIL